MATAPPSSARGASSLSINLHSAPADPTVLGFRLVHLLLFFGFSVILLLRYLRREASAVKSKCCSQSSYSPFLANVLILGGSDAHPCLRVLHACTGTCRYFIVRCQLLYYTDNIFTLCSFGRVLLCSAVLGPQGQTCIRLWALLLLGSSTRSHRQLAHPPRRSCVGLTGSLLAQPPIDVVGIGYRRPANRATWAPAVYSKRDSVVIIRSLSFESPKEKE